MTQTISVAEPSPPSAREGAVLAPWPSGGAAAQEGFQRLRQHLVSTAEHIWRFADLDPHIRMLEEIVFSLDDNGLTADIFLAGLPPSQVVLHQMAYCHWETELERRFVHNLGPSGDIDDYPLAARFRRLIEREVSLMSAHGRPQRVLFIGSGPVPVSAILLHQYLGVPIDCADADPLAVVQSRKLIEALRMSDAVRVHHADGISMGVANYDVIVIALLAKPKKEILAHLARAGRSDSCVICRTSGGLRTLVYEPMRLSRDLGRYEIQDRRLATGTGDTISSLRLSRTEV
jgi:hypothetical protein